ncbi:MAG TPA: tetratricopeptide repeat protein [Gemmatimonadales bacterium]|nr:tetratricopeptide repeat protein [Gemmatimonadales bacterium]
MAGLRVTVACAGLICGATRAAGLRAQAPADPAEGLGAAHFEISCSPAAQAAFDRAVALLHHMTYQEARAGFQRTAALDPRCAMAHWGVAMTLFQPLWSTRPSPADIRRGRGEIGRARALGPPTERERLFLEAGAAFFREPDSVHYWDRIRGWRQGMERVHAAYPQDAEAAAWLALATLAVPPAEGQARAQSDRAAELLLGVYRRNPEHPGAMHYLIHADDVPGREHEQPEVVGRYSALAPRNPHALHMPTHIYTRLGEWERVIQGNLRAAQAALEHPVGDGKLVWDEFPHAVEYAIYAYLQLGREREAKAQLERLRGTERLDPTFKTAFHLASTAARYALERRDWAGAMALRPREPAGLDWDRFAWAEAVTWFARGLGAAHLRRMEEAQAARARLEELESAAGRSGEPMFARQIGILRLALAGWVVQEEGRPDSAVALLRRAAALEASTPKPAVTPAPTLPAEELLGDLLLEQGRRAEALEAYRQSLKLYPGRRNSLAGAARATSSNGT